MDNDELFRYISEIENDIEYLGALNIIQNIFNDLEAIYDNQQQRYHLIQDFSQGRQGKPQIPWGCLYQLTLKNIQSEDSFPANTLTRKTRIIVTMFDHGSFNDREISRKILTTMLGLRLETSIEKHQKSFNELNEYSGELVKQYLES